MRPRLQWKERERIRAIDRAITVVRKQTAAFAEGGFYDSLAVFNVALHFLLAERDIQALKIDALTHPDAWMRGLALRVMLLTVYEWDTDKVTGKAFRDATLSLRLSQESRLAMTRALRATRKSRERMTKRFGNVRNYVIAHRDADALAQWRIIQELDMREALPLIGEFYDAVRLFIGALPDVMVAAGCSEAILKQMVEKGARLPGI